LAANPTEINELLSWNYRGLGNPWAVRALKKLTKMEVPNPLFVIETRKKNILAWDISRLIWYE